MSTARKPTFTLCVNDAPAGGKPHWRSIGAAWETQTGNLFLKVNEGETLRDTAMLFPYREKPPSAFHPSPPVQSASPTDYMERQRVERARRAPPPPATPPPGDYDADPAAPGWL